MKPYTQNKNKDNKNHSALILLSALGFILNSETMDIQSITNLPDCNICPNCHPDKVPYARESQ